MKKMTILLFTLIVFFSCGNDRDSPENGSHNKDNVHTYITWWELLSEEEEAHYREENKQYEADPMYNPKTTAPPPKVNRKMNNRKIGIGGFIVGVDSVPGDFQKVSSYLFVPYQGACAHVPPPPANQTIFVTMKEPVESDPYNPFILWGTIRIEEGENDLAAFSYVIEGTKLEPYKKPLQAES